MINQGTDSQWHTVDNVVVREVTERHRLAVRGHELGDAKRLAEDRIAILIPEILAVLILQRFQLQRRLVIHEPHAIAAIALIHGEVQAQHVIEGDIAGDGDARFSPIGIMQDTFRHRIAAPVDECVLLGLAEALGELPDQITLQIESGLTDVIQFQRCDDRQLMEVHMFLRAKGVVTRRDGGILRDPLGLVVHVSHPEHRVASRTGHHRTDLAEQVCVL